MSIQLYVTKLPGNLFMLPIIHLKKYNLFTFLFFLVALRPKAVHGPLILEVSRSHKTTHHSR